MSDSHRARRAQAQLARRGRSVSLTFGLVLVLGCGATLLPAAVILPGTQPNEGGIEFGKVAQCILCHARTKNGAADPYASWHGSLMGQAARDPVFRAGSGRGFQ
jgi:cytochrome c553